MVEICDTYTVTVFLNDRDHFRARLFLYYLNVVYDSFLLDYQSSILIKTTVILFIKDLAAHRLASLST